MKYALITDDQVDRLYGRALCEHLRSAGYDVQLFSFPAGESSKTRETKEQLEDALLSQGYSRDTTILALGGGVVTDLAGFLASTFCRGVDLILIPTTLMAMVDAAIGGKTGVNTEHGKNMIGSLYFPKAVIVHRGFLATLPDHEWFNGTVEILKAGLVADLELFENASLERAIEIKRRIVARDPEEKGLRRILNFGHTIGHALETLSCYQISHGEAVAAGIVLESQISYEMGILKASSYDQIRERFPPVSFDFEPEELLQVLCIDKKAAGGSPRFVLLKEIGAVLECDGAYCAHVPPEILKEVLCESCRNP